MPDHELRRQALHLRERGETYAEIGKALSVSRGKAHHMVRAEYERCAEDARDVARPPGRAREPSAERSSELLGRVTLDSSRVNRVISNHLDPTADEAGHLRSRLEQISLALDEGVATLEGPLSPARTTGHQEPRHQHNSTRRALSRIEQSFTELVGIAVEVDPTLREEVGEAFVLSVLSRDLEELAEIIGIPFTSAAATDDVLLPPGTPPAASDDASVSVHGLMPLDREGRHWRDERIVTARISGSPVKEVAKMYRVSERHVRRVLAAYHRDRSGDAPGVFDAVAQAHAQLRRGFDVLEAQRAAHHDQARHIAPVHGKQVGLLEREALAMRGAGLPFARLFSPEAYAAGWQMQAAVEDARFDWTVSANRRVRRLLEERGVPSETVEAVIDEIVAPPSPEDLL
jgi:transposase